MLSMRKHGYQKLQCSGNPTLVYQILYSKYGIKIEHIMTLLVESLGFRADKTQA